MTPLTTMRNQYATHTDFRDFQGLIPENTHFLPSNIDMICERKGHFLIGEWKKPNENMATGQQLLLKAFAQVPKFTVLVIIGNTVEFFQEHEIAEMRKHNSHWLTSSFSSSRI